MSANFYELLKYAATGQTSPGMTAFDKLKALAMCGGGLSPYTIIGQPPISFKSDGTPLTSVTIKGNGVQNGTPSPQNIVPFDGTGERTGNLFDKSSATVYNAYFNDSNTWIESDDSRSVVIPVNGETQYTLSVPEAMSVFRICEATQLPVIGDTYYRIVRASSAMDRYTFITRSDAKYIIFQGGRALLDTWFNGLMLNLGSTALPYEPYGWKIPLTCASQTTPLYLGEVSTVRRIKKLVLTGEEVLQLWKENYYSSIIDRKGKTSAILCTHLINSNEAGISYDAYSSFGLKIAAAAVPFVSSVNDLKAWLAAQYAAGHPVTVWYVLASETTGIVNEPLMKIGDYSDTLTTDTPIPTAKGSNELTVDTTVQPSEMSITYRG